MSERRLIISGTREALSAEERATVLDLVAPYVARGFVIGVGDCPTGVDAYIRAWLGNAAHVFEALWGTLGAPAGPERNGRMVRWAAEVPGGVLLAFPGPKSRGTPDCVRQARAAGLDVIVTKIGGVR